MNWTHILARCNKPASGVETSCPSPGYTVISISSLNRPDRLVGAFVSVWRSESTPGRGLGSRAKKNGDRRTNYFTNLGSQLLLRISKRHHHNSTKRAVKVRKWVLGAHKIKRCPCSVPLIGTVECQSLAGSGLVLQLFSAVPKLSRPRPKPSHALE